MHRLDLRAATVRDVVVVVVVVSALRVAKPEPIGRLDVSRQGGGGGGGGGGESYSERSDLSQCKLSKSASYY